MPSSDWPHFPDVIRQISPYETRSSGYRSQTDVRSSAPSPQNLTGKPSLTYSVGPFMVELFTARCLPARRQAFAESSRRSHPDSVCRQTEAPHASRVEGTRFRKPQPHGRDFHPLCIMNQSVHDGIKLSSNKSSIHRHGFVSLRSLSASPAIKRRQQTIRLRRRRGVACRALRVEGSSDAHSSVRAARCHKQRLPLDRTPVLLRGGRFFLTVEACD